MALSEVSATEKRFKVWEEEWVFYKEREMVPGFHKSEVNSLLLEHADLLFPSGDTVDKDATILVPLCGK